MKTMREFAKEMAETVVKGLEADISSFFEKDYSLEEIVTTAKNDYIAQIGYSDVHSLKLTSDLLSRPVYNKNVNDVSDVLLNVLTEYLYSLEGLFHNCLYVVGFEDNEEYYARVLNSIKAEIDSGRWE